MQSDSGHLYMIVCDLLEDREEEDIPMVSSFLLDNYVVCTTSFLNIPNKILEKV